MIGPFDSALVGEPEQNITQSATFVWNFIDCSGKRLTGLPDSGISVVFIFGNGIEVGIFSGEEDDFGFWSESGNEYFEAESVKCWVYSKDFLETTKLKKESPLANI